MARIGRSYAARPTYSHAVFSNRLDEDFDTSDQASIVTATGLDLKWGVVQSTIAVLSNRASGTATGPARARAEHLLDSMDMWVEAVGTNTLEDVANQNVNLALRVSAGDNSQIDMYVCQFQFQANNVRFQRTVDGTSTLISTSSTVALVAGTDYTFRFEVTGDINNAALVAKVDGTTVHTFTDTGAVAAGFQPDLFAGFALQEPSTGESRLNQWSAGTTFAGADQNLTGTTFTRAGTFPQGAVTATYDLAGTTFTRAGTYPQGAITATRDLAGTTFTRAGTFPQGSITATYDLAGTTFVRAGTFPQGAVTATYNLTGTTFTKAGTFPQGTVTPGAVDLAGTTFTKSGTFPQGSITTDGAQQDLTGTVFTKSGTFPAGTVSSTYDLAGTTFVRAGTFPQGAVTSVRDLAGTTFVRAGTFPQGAITSVRDLTGTTFQRSGTFPQGSITTTYTLTGTTFTKAPTFPTGVITAAGGDQSLAGVVFTKAGTFPQGTITPGPVNLGGTTFVRAPTFPLGAITAGAVNLAGATFVRAGFFPTGIISQGVLGTPVPATARALSDTGSNGATIRVGANGAAMSGANSAT